ncbi:hypothetical protein RJ640_020526, partial [Escallonia rubra]
MELWIFVTKNRFHLLSEFDNGKRSCRKRLADHNRRRRKSQQQQPPPPPPNQESSKSQLEKARNSSSESLARSPADSGAHASSSVTVAISPPRISLWRKSSISTEVDSIESNDKSRSDVVGHYLSRVMITKLMLKSNLSLHARAIKQMVGLSSNAMEEPSGKFNGIVGN